MTINMRVDARYQTLAAGFFISGRTINLSGKEEVLDLLRLQVMIQLCRIEEIVFNRISRTINLHITKSRDCLQGSQLYLQGQGRRESVQI